MVAYAGATWDWHRLHYDPDFARPRRLTGPVVDGQVFGALLAERSRTGSARARSSASCRLPLPNLVFAGETVRCDGGR